MGELRLMNKHRQPHSLGQTLTMIDLFAGAGGLSQGLTAAGFSVLYANEIMAPYARTYLLNHPETIFTQGDIREVDPKSILHQIGIEPGELDLLAGGPPCQGFSINAPVRSLTDSRNHLFLEFLRFVKVFQPKSILIENVPGLVSFENGSTLAEILKALMDLGYFADVRILYAPNYGIPQTRWRTIILGFRDFTPINAFPVPTTAAPARVNFTANFDGRNIVSLPTRNDDLSTYTTVQEAIGDLPPLANGEVGADCKDYRCEPENSYQRKMRRATPGVYNHAATKLSKINLQRMAYIPPGGNWTGIPFDLLPAGMQKARLSDHTKRYGRVDPNGLASTILTKCDPHWGAYFHYNQERAFTVREAARLQSFPDSFIFTGTRIEQFEQVGNAVPPLLAEAVGRSVAGTLIQADAYSLKAVS